MHSISGLTVETFTNNPIELLKLEFSVSALSVSKLEKAELPELLLLRIYSALQNIELVLKITKN